MGIFDAFRKKPQARDRPAPRAQAEQPKRRRRPRNGMRILNSWGAAKETVRGNEIYYAGVSRIANTVGMLPCHLYKDKEIQREDPLELLVSLRPNRRQSWFDFIKASEIWRNTEGRVYWLKLCDPLSMEVDELVILDPTKVRTREDPVTHELWYDIVRPYGQIVDRVHSWYVLPFTHMSTDGVEGVRVSDVLSGSIDYDKRIKEYSEKQLSGVTRGVVLSSPTDMDEDKRIAAVDEFVEIYKRSNGTVMALDAGMTATQFNLSPVDPQVLGVEKITRNRIATVLNMPPHLLGDYSDAGPTTVEQTNLEFLTMTITAIVTMYKQGMNWQLLTPERRKAGEYFDFEVEAMLRADLTAKANYYFQAVRTGYLMLDEVRARENLPAFAEGLGSVPLVSKDLAPIKLVLSGGTIDAPNRPAPAQPSQATPGE